MVEDRSVAYTGTSSRGEDKPGRVESTERVEFRWQGRDGGP